MRSMECIAPTEYYTNAYHANAYHACAYHACAHLLSSAQVADFGSAYSGSRVENQMHGTPPYMAPEVVRREQPVKPSDVWSFGGLIAHMGSRELP